MRLDKVPVVDREGRPLMPCSRKRAFSLRKRGEATFFRSNGVLCIRLNREPSARNMQPIAVGVDPGSKREGFSVQSEAHELLNVDAGAKDWVGKKLKSRRQCRRSRRNRKTPNRSPQRNDDNHSRVPAGTRARWEWKYRVLEWLAEMYPITDICVEDIKAMTKKGKRRWNASFSPLEQGKELFYGLVSGRWTLHIFTGFDTYTLRNVLGLRKSSAKLADKFTAHCVDAWVLVQLAMRWRSVPHYTDVLRIAPLQRQRRNLHVQNYAKGGIRKVAGGTNKGGFKTGTLVRHPKYGLCYTSGSQKGRISLHSVETGKRLTPRARVEECTRYRAVSWRRWYVQDETEFEQRLPPVEWAASEQLAFV